MGCYICNEVGNVEFCGRGDRLIKWGMNCLFL